MINEDVIKRDVKRFRFGRDGRIDTLEFLKDSLETKLYTYNRDIEKKFFLRLKRDSVEEAAHSHKIKCTTPNCPKDDAYKDKIFIIDQAIEEINKYYEFEAPESEYLTAKEETIVHTTLNELKIKLNELFDFTSESQEVLFNELDDIKQHLNLGRKNILALMKGKLLSLVEDEIIDKPIMEFLNENLFKNFDDPLLIGS